LTERPFRAFMLYIAYNREFNPAGIAQSSQHREMHRIGGWPGSND
jgi:hypothetical protein